MPEEASEADSARRAVAAELRHLADRLASDDFEPSVLDTLAGGLRAMTDGLGPAAGGLSTRFSRSLAAALAEQVPPEEARRIQGDHPLNTGASGVYPVVRTEVDLPRMTAEVDFTPAYEGPPGLVHGGFLAAGFDIVLSALALLVLDHSVTRWLRLRYLAPTFLGGPVRYELEAEPPKGRTVDLAGQLVDAEGRVTMRATAQFASVDLARFANRRTTLR